MNRLSIVCLGVRDMPTSVRFYRDGLGFEPNKPGDNPDSMEFKNVGSTLSLFPLDLMVLDINKDDPPKVGDGFGGITLEHIVRTREEVDEIAKKAIEYGGKMLKEPQYLSWGGYHTYFTDPDGYLWEVTHNPDFELDENDMVIF